MLDVQDLSIFSQGRWFLKNQSFHLNSEEIVGIFGSPHSGKSLLLRTLLGLAPARTGQIYFQKSPLSPESRRKIGYLPQYWGFPPEMTVEEFLATQAFLFQIEPLEKTLVPILELLDLTKQRHLPLKLLESRKKIWVGIARMLLTQPELLILDEPFLALEESKKKEFRAVLQEMTQMRHTVLLTSTRLSDLTPICHRVLFLLEGEFLSKEKIRLFRPLLEKTYILLRPHPQKIKPFMSLLTNYSSLQKIYQLGEDWIVGVSEPFGTAQKELKIYLGETILGMEKWDRSLENILAELQQATLFRFEITANAIREIYAYLKNEPVLKELHLQEEVLTGAISGYEGRETLEDSLYFQGFTSFQIRWSVFDAYYFENRTTNLCS
ncbi:MAG: ATP-binding cassette domain-containing protein [Planctomycetota bacterium]